MASTVRKILGLALPSILLAGLASFALIEAWVRFSWDDKRGTPGFYLSDPVLGQRLAPGYTRNRGLPQSGPGYDAARPS